MSHQDFINTLVPFIVKYCKQFNYPFVSPILAQAILESSWGTSYKAIIGNNFFGLKYSVATRVPSASGYFFDGGSEQLADGSYIPLNAKTTKWCKFDSIEKGVKGYFEFLINGYGRYDQLPTAISPLDYLQKIKNAGYATSIHYVTNVYKVVSNNQLTQYDKLLQQNKESNASINNDSLNITKVVNTHNLTSINNRRIEWIILHYTAGTKSVAGAAKNTALWFANQQCKASADFIVDDSTIVQYNPDPLQYYSWAVGGNKYSILSTSLGAQYYGIAKNNNSISIEMCSNKKNTKVLNATDPDWYFTNETINQTIKLTQYLMKLYNIDKNHVIMHHQVTGKICPNPWCVNETALVYWNDFLNKLGAIDQKIVIQNNNSILESRQHFTVKVLVPNLNIRTSPNGAKLGKFTGVGVFTIVEQQNDWGLLKAYSNKRNGWIYLGNSQYTQRI